MHRLTTRAAIMLLIATFATGCDASRGELAQTFMNRGAGAEAPSSVAGAAGTPGQSSSSMTHAGSGELPAAWPPDVALPANSQIGATTSIVSGDTTVLSVSGRVSAPAHVVRAHFDDQFAGWNADSGSWRQGVATWTLGLARARVVVGEQGGSSRFIVRLD